MDQNNSLEINDGSESANTSSLESSDATTAATGNNGINTGEIVDKTPVKKKLPLRQRITKGINVYLLLFILLLIVAGVIATIIYFSSKKASQDSIDAQTLTSETLKELATSDVTVGQPKQTLSVQSNAVFAGKVLVRDSLEVAGTIQVGGSLNVPGITVSGNSIFEQIQINKGLSVVGDTSLQGQLTVQKNLTVAGGATFGGSVSAPQLSVTSLQLNGNLTITKHIIVGGATPNRSNGDALGSGGTTALSGSDVAGSININTGSSPSAGCFATVTFSQKYNTVPRVLITPIGSSAGPLAYYVTRSSTNFSVCTASAPPSNTSFGFDYFIVE